MNKKVILTGLTVCFILVTLMLTKRWIDQPSQYVDEVTSGQHFSKAHKQFAEAKLINQNMYKQAADGSTLVIKDAVPTSLQGIRHNIRLLVESDGNLIVNQDTKELFEFYLSAMGEEPLESILSRVQNELTTQLEQPALRQAQSLLKRFIDYKIELAELDAQTGDESLSQVNRIKQQKLQLAELRNRYFGANEYGSFFEQEDIYDNFMIDHLSISQNVTLDKEEKRQRLDALEKTLPEALRNVRKKATKHADVYEAAVNMRKEGASDEDVYQMRAETLGDDAAKAMAELDVSRRQWKQRLDDYTAQRNEIMDSGLSQQDAVVAINELIDTQFTGTERVRVRALNSAL